jgi:hypothetical protein
MALTGGLLTGEDATKQGLGWASNVMQNAPENPYPGYVSGAGQSPSQLAYSKYTPNAPMAQITAPNYELSAQKQNWNQWTPQQGNQYQTIDPNAQTANFNWNNTSLTGQNVTNPYSAYGGNVAAQSAQINPSWGDTGLGMQNVANPYSAYGGADQSYQKLSNTPAYAGLLGGDYDALQRALTTPGELAAKTAYDQGQTNLANTMGGRGLYGSSIMQDQARTALDTPYQNTLATNAANAAVQRYAQQAADLQNKNQFGLNVYGQQQAENQAANQQAYNTWGARLGENQAGQQMGLQAGLANQSTNAQLQGLNLQQGLAQNQQGYNVALANQADIQNQNALAQQQWQQRLAENQSGQQMGLQAQQSNQAANTQLQQLLSQQGLAQNAAALDYSKLQTNVNQQNVANQLAQAQAQNVLKSGDTQQLQGLMAAQNTAQNAYGKDMYGLDISREQAANAQALQGTQMMATQNANTYAAQAADASRQTAFDQSKQQYDLQRAEAARAWQNQYGVAPGQTQSYDQSQYQQGQNLYENQVSEAKINQALALAGQGNQAGTAASNYQMFQQNLAAQRAAAEANINAQNQAGWLGLAGTGIGAAGMLGYGLLPK